MARTHGEPDAASEVDAETQTDGASVSHEAVARLRRAARRRKVNFNIANTAAYTGMAFMIAWTWWLIQQMARGVQPFSLPLTWTLLAGYGVSLVITFAYTWRGAREVKEATQSLTESSDVSVVGPLLEAMEMGEPMYDFSTLGRSDRPVVGMAAQALVRLLPRLQASDAPALTPHQRARLYRAIELSALAPSQGTRAWRGNSDFAIAALRGLEQIGDSKAVALVERLAEKARDPQVREAALECLPMLQERATIEQSNATLLRAADPTRGLATSPDMLLRPAFAAQTTDPTELLRAATPSPDTAAQAGTPVETVETAEQEIEPWPEALPNPLSQAKAPTTPLTPLSPFDASRRTAARPSAEEHLPPLQNGA